MNKKVFIVLVAIYFIMFGLNYLVPLYYGDDLVYAFIWSNQYMNIPLPETVVRVNSVTDILISQWRHYFTCNGRTIAHLLIQLFVWQGKWLFNLVNPFVFVLLILQILWFANKGEISFKNLRVNCICWIFLFYGLLLQIFTACIYGWQVPVIICGVLFFIIFLNAVCSYIF